MTDPSQPDLDWRTTAKITFAGIAGNVLEWYDFAVMRMIQGLSVGGEYTTSVVFLVESAPVGRRGLIASASPLGATAGTLLGSAAGALTSLFLPADQIEAWGWRLPFLSGIFVGVAGLLVRRHLPAAPKPAGALAEAHSPILEAFRLQWRNMLQVAGLNAFLAVGFYLAFVYAVTFLENVVHLPTAAAFDINTLNMLALLVVIPASGHLSDCVGRKPVLTGACVGGLLLAWPLWWLMHHHNLNVVFVGQFGLAIVIGLFSGVVPVTMAEALPARVRCTAMSVSYNLCVGLLGGTTPMIATYLIERTGSDFAPAFFLMTAAAISLITLRTLSETGQGTVA